MVIDDDDDDSLIGIATVAFVLCDIAGDVSCNKHNLDIESL